MNIQRYVAIIALVLVCSLSHAQSFQFAFVSDTHIGNPTAQEDLERIIADINANPNLKFVVVTGYITEFGSDEELKLARRIFDTLKDPWYMVPGNHNSNWSESGGNSFWIMFKQPHKPGDAARQKPGGREHDGWENRLSGVSA